MTPPLLDGLRVLDCSTGITGGYTAKLLGDAGADVITVEPRGGDPLRSRSASGKVTGGLFAFLHGGHRGTVGTAADEHVRALAAEADVVVESNGPRDDGVRALRDAHSHLVVVSISPFGLGAPRADRPWTEFTLQALGGSTASRGLKQTPPTHAAGELTEWYAAPYAATAAVAAWREARATGRGAHVDVSLLEVACLVGQYAPVMWQFFGKPQMPARQRIVMIPCVEPTKDGWVGFSTITGQQFQDFLALIEAIEYLDDAEMASQAGRLARADEIGPVIRAWTSRHTTDEVIERATALRIPVAPIGTGDTVTAFAHFEERGVFAAHPDGFTAPLPPWRVHGEPRPQHRSAPSLDPDSRPEWAPRPSGTTFAARHAGPLPLSGVRVIDFTMFWAGPAATHALAALGADVVKIESVQRADGMRYTSARGPGTDAWWEWGWIFHGINANKRGVTLDLDAGGGRAIAEQLVAGADIVVENYTPRVVERFGLDFEAVRRLNPRAVMVRMPGFGLDGPWRDWPGWANTMEQASGLASISGWPDTAPWIPNGQLDPVAGQHAAFLAIAGLERRARTGEGCLVELPMVEVGLTIASEQVIEWSAAGVVRERDGNHGPFAAPQGVYACAGTEQWIAISVTTDEEWRALVQALDSPDWAADRALATHDGRRAAQASLDEHLASELAARDRDEVHTALLAAGVPSAPVVNPTDLLDLDTPSARGFFEPVEHPVTGAYLVPTLPFRWTGVDRWVRRAAPTLGQDNDTVLDELGITATERARLRAEHVIGERPLGA
jgi:crotonobetainyl-CoA:carnitine CoA-transferase CaiB-like acyl-CoA transferase